MVALIAKQHLLPSIRWLLEQLIVRDVFSSIDILGKYYSTIPEVEDQLPAKAVLRNTLAEHLGDIKSQEFVILDEGGTLYSALLESSAVPASGVEQTTFGLRDAWLCPMVLVCRSAAKLFFESQIIARGIIRKLDSLGLLENRTIGIIGLGALGRELAQSLLDRGIPTFGTDAAQVPSGLRAIAVEKEELLGRCDIILGCTGRDSLNVASLENLMGHKLFISCSSSDIEFRSLARRLPCQEPFVSLRGAIGKLDCTLLNSGYPINFDRLKEWETFEEILLTRKLVLEGLLQAKELIGSGPGGVMLDPYTQYRAVMDWLDLVPNRKQLRMPSSLTPKFFLDHSEGHYLLSKRPSYTLHHTTPGALAAMRLHREPYEVMVRKLPIVVLPNVWSPAHDWSSLFFIENMPELTGHDFLEIGSGTGLISVFASHAGAASIVAVDVNDAAVENTQLNFRRFHVDKAEAFKSDGFSDVRGQFDVIVWNAPYHGSRPNDDLERGCADENYGGIRNFFRDVGGYLKPGGKVIFGFSESGDLPLIEALIAINGFQIKRKLSDWRQNYNCMLFELERSGSSPPVAA